MRFGIREICDVVLRAKSYQTLGNRKFYKMNQFCTLTL